MALIDTTYFQAGITFIPNNNNVNVEIPGVPSSGSDLQLFIDIHERELLINALGIVLYEEYESNPSETRWQELINGKTYEVNSNSYRWDGLLGSNKQSLIAFYVFCEYLRNNQSVYTTTGVVLPSAANSMDVDPTEKYMSCYTSFIKSYQGNYGYYNGCFDYNNPRVIVNCSGMVGLDYSRKSNDSFVNMYQYMTDQNTLDANTFPDFKFKFYQMHNSWGLR